MPNREPDPACKDCKGTGKIPLLTSSCDCDCLNRAPGIIEWKTKFDHEAFKKQMKAYPFEEYSKEYEEPIMTPKFDGSRYLLEPKDE